MDPQQFDDLIRKSSQGGSRRAALRMLTTALAAAIGLAAQRPALAQEVSAEIYGLCKFPTGACSSDSQCCSHKCRDGACTCKPKGARCFSAAGLVCCSRRCKRGRCK